MIAAHLFSPQQDTPAVYATGAIWLNNRQGHYTPVLLPSALWFTFFHLFSSELWLTLLLKNLVIIDFAAAREGPFLWSKTPVFDTVLGTWSLVLQSPGCIPAVWISLSSDTSTGSGSRHCCLGHLGFSDSRCPLHSRSCVLWPSRHMIWHWHLAFAVLGT